MLHCMVPYCTNVWRKTKGTGVSYHCSPITHMKNVWLQRIQQHNPRTKTSTRRFTFHIICAKLHIAFHRSYHILVSYLLPIEKCLYFQHRQRVNTICDITLDLSKHSGDVTRFTAATYCAHKKMQYVDFLLTVFRSKA